MPVFHHPRRVVIDEGGETQPAKALIPLAAVLVGVGILGLIETILGWLNVALGVLGNVPVPLVLLLPGALAFAAAGFIIGRRATLTIHPAPPLGGPIQARVIAVGPPRRALGVPEQARLITRADGAAASQDIAGRRH